MPQYIGVDLHRRRSVTVRMNEAGEVLEKRRFENSAEGFAQVVEAAGEHPEVVVEAAYGWYWVADLLEDLGATVHLAHPLGVKGFQYQRVKKDETDARHLADLLRLRMLPEAWLAPAEVRELRERVRHRAALVAWRSAVRAHVHAVLAKEGIAVTVSDLFGQAGRQQLATIRLGAAYQDRVDALLRLHEVLDAEVERAMAQTRRAMSKHPAYAAVQEVPGVGPVLGAVFVAEIGEVGRFRSAQAICSWAGLTPKHRESDTTVHRGRITKQGSKLVRWAAVEAVHHLPHSCALFQQLAALELRRGHNVAATAVARKLLVLVYYAMRDGGLRAPRRQVA